MNSIITELNFYKWKYKDKYNNIHTFNKKKTIKMNNNNKKKNNNKLPLILKYTFLYFDYLSKSKIVIIESKQCLQT